MSARATDNQARMIKRFTARLRPSKMHLIGVHIRKGCLLEYSKRLHIKLIGIIRLSDMQLSGVDSNLLCGTMPGRGGGMHGLKSTAGGGAGDQTKN